MLGSDHVGIARRGAEDVSAGYRFFHRYNFKTFHRRLQCADRIDFGNHNTRAAVAERLRRAFADIAEAGDASDFTGQHDIGRATNCIDQRFFAAIQIIELRLGHAVVDVDRREREFALLGDFIQTVDAGSGFFRHALQVFDGFRQITRLLGDERLQRALEFDFFLVFRFGKRLTALQLCTP